MFSLCNNSSSNCPHLYTYMFIHVSFCFLRVCACLAFVSARPKLEKRRSTVKAVSMISIIPIYSSAPSPQHDCCYMYAPYIYIYASRSERDRELPLQDGHWEHQGADNGEQRAHLLAEHIGVASQSTFKSNSNHIKNPIYHTIYIYKYRYVHLIIVGRER